MTSREFRERLTRRARHAGVSVEEAAVERLEAYFRLLARWNEKINLTALPLKSPTHETFDRLLVEPLAAARHIENRPARWYDLGSGGGSPALPLKVVRPALDLTLVESKVRKAAFLREAIRVLEFDTARVENTRFETLVLPATGGSGRPPGRMPFVTDARQLADLITVRAVKVDAALLRIAGALLGPAGKLFLFRPTDRPFPSDGFKPAETLVLTPDEPRAYLTVLARCSTWNKAVDAPLA